MGQTLLRKVWDLHTVRQLATGQTQLFIGLHLVHEVTSPQAFDALRANGWKVAFLDRTFATVDHIVPTRERQRPFLDVMAEDMISALERNCRDFGVRLAGLGDDRQGIVHVIGPELGLTQPGMTIACGDSHTSTHGAFGSVAFGIGTSQVRDVLASQCLAIEPMKVRRIRVNGALPQGVYAKDVILEIIQRLGVSGGIGYAYEYAGDTVEPDVDGRAHDDLQHVHRRRRARRLRQPGRDDHSSTCAAGRSCRRATRSTRVSQWWRSMASDPDAVYDDDVEIRADELAPVVTWGVQPRPVGQRGRAACRPRPTAGADAAATTDALAYMGLTGGQPIAGMKVDVAFVGSCTNSRLSDLREAARIVHGRNVARARQGARRARVRLGRPGRRTRGSGRRLPRCRVRMARRRVLDVPGDEPRQARGQPGVRLLVEPQLQGPAGQSDRAARCS